MKLFLTFILFSFSFVAVAQEAQKPSLFPMLEDFSKETTEEPEKIQQEKEEKAEENITTNNEELPSNEENLFDQKTPTEVNTTEDDSSEKDEEDDDDKKQHIYLSIDDVDATLTPNKNASFCTLKLVIKNDLKKDLKAFSGTLRIENVTKNFNFSNIKKGASNEQGYMIIGTACQNVLDPPVFDFTECKVENWSEKRCKEKVEFIPIPKSNI